MFTWTFVCISCLICPLMMLIYGIRFAQFQPKKEGICGLRIKDALRNDETWHFAHQYCGRLWQMMGMFMASAVIICMIILFKCSELVVAVSGVVILFIQLIVFICSFCLISKAIVKNFGKL